MWYDVIYNSTDNGGYTAVNLREIDENTFGYCDTTYVLNDGTNCGRCVTNLDLRHINIIISFTTNGILIVHMLTHEFYFIADNVEE